VAVKLGIDGYIDPQNQLHHLTRRRTVRIKKSVIVILASAAALALPAATASAEESCIQVYLVKPGCLTDLPPIT
jgi:hypothetical protein